MLEALFAGEDLDRFLKKSIVSRTQKSEVRNFRLDPVYAEANALLKHGLLDGAKDKFLQCLECHGGKTDR